MMRDMWPFFSFEEQGDRFPKQPRPDREYFLPLQVIFQGLYCDHT